MNRWVGLPVFLRVCFRSGGLRRGIPPDSAPGMVPDAAQAAVESSRLDFRAGVDGVVPDDGDRGLADMARPQYQRGGPRSRVFPVPIDPQRVMDCNFFRDARS